jgi:hypothetical protein
METALVKQEFRVMVGDKDASTLPESQFLDPSFTGRSAELKEFAEGVEAVTSAMSKGVAEKQIVEINQFVDKVDTLKQSSTLPFQTVVNRIKTATDALIKPLLIEKERITGLLRGFARKEMERLQAEEQVRLREARALQEQAAQLQANVAAAAASGDKGAEEKAKLQVNIVQTQAAKLIPTAEEKAPEGFWDYELTGATPEENERAIIALIAVKPGLVKVEIKANPLRQYLKDMDGKVELAGIKVFKNCRVNTRR